MARRPTRSEPAREGSGTRGPGGPEERTGRVERIEVVVVGGGPAGAVLAGRLARSGHEVVVLERAPAWHWRAGGVFASPAAVAALRRAGLDEPTLARVARPIPAMRVETRSGTTFRLTYGADAGGGMAVGFDRSGLDPALLDLAARNGADVRRGWSATAFQPGAGRIVARGPDGASLTIEAEVVVGADGPRSVVARATGVSRPARLDPRVGLTYHLSDPEPTDPRDARMLVLEDGYVGIAPVAGGRVNVGIVLGRSWRAAIVADGALAVAARIVAAIPPTDEDHGAWRCGAPTERVAGAWPIGHRVTRRAGPGWLLIGDAAGFLDPFTGEGLHRAVVSAELAAAAVAAHRRGRTEAFAAYERAMQRRFMTKDAVSWLVQAFLGEAGPLRVRRQTGRRPAGRSCDDGSRDGRSGPSRPRARPALSRLAPRAVTGEDAPDGMVGRGSTRPTRTRLGSYAICLDDAGRILLARLSPFEVEAEVGAWTLPGGGVDFGEHPDVAVIRELEEETGLHGAIVSVGGIFSHVYPDSPFARGGDLHFLGIIYRVRVTGGDLRAEVGGSTDTCAWTSLDEIRTLEAGRGRPVRDRPRLPGPLS